MRRGLVLSSSVFQIDVLALALAAAAVLLSVVCYVVLSMVQDAAPSLHQFLA
jgi:hypothetical protein